MNVILTPLFLSYQATLQNVMSLEQKIANKLKKIRPGTLAALKLQRIALERKQSLLEKED